MATRSDNRYNMRPNADGFWTVYDIFTGEPAETRGVFLTRRTMEEADDLVDLLNAEYIKRRSGEAH